jgi:uncharacterized protein (DUF924 family)
VLTVVQDTGRYKQLTPCQRVFVLLPLEHTEDLQVQQVGTAATAAGHRARTQQLLVCHVYSVAAVTGADAFMHQLRLLCDQVPA